NILTDLSHFSVIQFAGEDDETFLQGQLSCDVRQALQNHAQYGSYCTPKGRMLATFLLWRNANGFQMQLPAALRETIQKRLGMYVMRSRVKVSDASAATVRLGIAGPGAADAVAELGSTAPVEDYAVAQIGPANVIRLPGKRFELVLSPEDAPSVWQILSKHCTPVGSGRWEWLDIQAGIPTVTAGTQEQFVPQMANLELIGGVSFKKGCYPGQEIVARSQYLGKVKRRMYLVHIQSDTAPQAGDALFGQGPAEQSGGMIVNAQASPQGGYDALAVILSTSLESGAVTWKTPDGPVLQLLSLPYSIE
ncbi:MAG: folate-binding protein, partial [Sulfurimicrobium sp.]|nr:folate-binding protein [Sulfurimicrobium sp.]